MYSAKWQQQPCPEWCTVAHTDEDHPHDRTHRDDGVAVPAILRKRFFDEGVLVEHNLESQIVLGRWQRDGEEQAWRFLGTDDGVEIELSEESFQRLAVAISEMRTLDDRLQQGNPPPEP